MRVFGLTGPLPTTVVWLKATPGGADLFEEPASPDSHLSSKLQFERLYDAHEFLAVARGRAATSFKPAATAALDLVDATLQDTAYVGRNFHTFLLANLNAVQRAAQAIVDDDGKDVAATSTMNSAFLNALRQAVNTVATIASRTTETQDAKNKSRQLAVRLKAIAGFGEALPGG